MFQKMYPDGGQIEGVSKDQVETSLIGYYRDIGLAIEAMEKSPGRWIVRTPFALYRYITRTADDNLLDDLKKLKEQLKGVADIDVAYSLMYQITEKYGYPILSGQDKPSARISTKVAGLLVTFSPGGVVLEVELTLYDYWH